MNENFTDTHYNATKRMVQSSQEKAMGEIRETSIKHLTNYLQGLLKSLSEPNTVHHFKFASNQTVGFLSLIGVIKYWVSRKV